MGAPANFLLLALVLLSSSSGTFCHVQRTTAAAAPVADENLCDTCIAAARIASDYLCDFEFVAWAVEQVEGTLCEAVPQKEDCKQVRKRDEA